MTDRTGLPNANRRFPAATAALACEPRTATANNAGKTRTAGSCAYSGALIEPGAGAPTPGGEQ